MERANGVRGRLRVGGGRGGWYFIERVRKRKREGNSWGVCEEKERERQRETETETEYGGQLPAGYLYWLRFVSRAAKSPCASTAEEEQVALCSEALSHMTLLCFKRLNTFTSSFLEAAVRASPLGREKERVCVCVDLYGERKRERGRLGIAMAQRQKAKLERCVFL